MKDWALTEIKLACKKENPDIKIDDNGVANEFDYVCACYESAYKAFKSLLEDGHSGMSIGFTKQILNRLIDGKCLTPIEDTDDIWNEVRYEMENGTHSYQCKRMSSFFKDVSPDGTIKYHDGNRTIVEDQNGMTWQSGGASRLVDKMFPLTMPYFPSNKPYRVFSEEFLVDPKNGDYDTWAYLYVVTPEGEKIELNQYWCEKDGKDVQITKEEYEKRKLNEYKGER